jgi:arsenate reductase
MPRLWHNPRCSKSRAALKLLEERGAKVEIYRYLDTPPDKAALDTLLKKLAIPAAALVRKGEAPWKDSGLTPDSPEDKVRALILANPILIERPILETGKAAIIGRPPESILDLL